MTPLAEKLIAQIRANGPITVAEYMAACLGDPEHGYYLTRDPFGRSGDFITAPEVSQMFGELIGAWTALAWKAMGAPAPFVLAELGPGRGTLMADLIRAARIRPAFGKAARIHLVETSSRLRAAQEVALAACGSNVTWQARIDELPPGPLIVIANEFFDALPIRQFVLTREGWAERMVGIDDGGRLVFGLRRATPVKEIREVGSPDRTDTVVETSPAATAIMQTLAAHIAANGGAGLFIDYGYEGPASGDTLQAVRRHRFDDPLAAPGEADLTAHVDFTALSKTADETGAVSRPVMSQGAFLARLGIMERAVHLGAGKDAATQAAIEAAVERLCGPKAMGRLFKVLAIAEPGLALPAFDDDVPSTR